MRLSPLCASGTRRALTRTHKNSVGVLPWASFASLCCEFNVCRSLERTKSLVGGAATCSCSSHLGGASSGEGRVRGENRYINISAPRALVCPARVRLGVSAGGFASCVALSPRVVSGYASVAHSFAQKCGGRFRFCAPLVSLCRECFVCRLLERTKISAGGSATCASCLGGASSSEGRVRGVNRYKNI